MSSVSRAWESSGRAAAHMLMAGDCVDRRRPRSAVDGSHPVTLGSASAAMQRGWAKCSAEPPPVLPPPTRRAAPLFPPCLRCRVGHQPAAVPDHQHLLLVSASLGGRWAGIKPPRAAPAAHRRALLPETASIRFGLACTLAQCSTAARLAVSTCAACAHACARTAQRSISFTLRSERTRLPVPCPPTTPLPHASLPACLAPRPTSLWQPAFN
mgnify:CR=1 FL=1